MKKRMVKSNVEGRNIEFNEGEQTSIEREQKVVIHNDVVTGVWKNGILSNLTVTYVEGKAAYLSMSEFESFVDCLVEFRETVKNELSNG